MVLHNVVSSDIYITHIQKYNDHKIDLFQLRNDDDDDGDYDVIPLH